MTARGMSGTLHLVTASLSPSRDEWFNLLDGLCRDCRHVVATIESRLDSAQAGETEHKL